MKTTFVKAFQILIGLVLLAEVLHFIVDLPPETNRVINSLMFILIGISYLVMGWIWKRPLPKLVIISCCLYLVAMNFFSGNTVKDIIAIICLLVPMLIARFEKQENSDTTDNVQPEQFV